MAKKKTSAKPARKAVRKATGPRRVVSMAVQLLTRGLSESAEHEAANALAVRAARGAPRAAVAAAAKAVVFSCSNPNCVVGITAGTINIVFVSTGGATMPVGSFPIFWRVQGTGPFAVTVQGAALSSPINSVAPDAGIRTLTVPA
jgi:hypothetical protein